MQSLPSEEEDDINSPLVTLTEVGVLCNASRQSLETCMNQGLVATRGGSPTGDCTLVSCMHPPAILNQLPGVNPQGVLILMRMTQEVTFPRG